jgi:hypothetical protein
MVLSARSTMSSVQRPYTDLGAPPYPYTKKDTPYSRDNRPHTPSGGVYMSNAAFRSKTNRFKYTGRMVGNEVHDACVHQLAERDRPEKYRPPKAKPRGDGKSEIITGMTFARAMGLDETVHKPKGQDRDIAKPPLLDYDFYDPSPANEKKRASVGFKFPKVARDNGRFYGTAWRGCAAITPGNMNNNPVSYVKPAVMSESLKTDVSKIMRSTAPARGTMDSLRMGLVGMPSAKSSVGEKLGPGYYPFQDAKKKIQARGTIRSNPRMPASEFLGPGRKPRIGDKFDVFGTAHQSAVDEEFKQTRIKAMKKTGDDGEGDKLDPFSLYKNVEPVASERFLKVIEKNDHFHAVLKRVALDGETDADRQYKADAIKGARAAEKVRDLWERLDNRELLVKEEVEDLEDDEGGYV